MRFRLLPVVCCFGLMLAGTARSQDLPTTHDHGITITPDHLAAAIQESQDFWGPVRKHLLSEECTLGEPELRKEAVAFLKSIHDGLHNRLFQQTEAEAMDLVRYLGHRLRMFEVYRRLRTEIGDDAALYALIEQWEKEYRDIHELPVAERSAKVEALLASMPTAMRQHSISDAKIAAAQPLWKMQSEVLALMAATDAGRMMHDFEKQAKHLSPQVGGTLLSISTAADWVLIVREPEQSIGRLDFLKSFAVLAELRAKRTAAGGTTSLR
jgi:hypothetical protein